MNSMQTGRARITTRVDSETLAEIERLARKNRTNIAQVTRCLIEDAIAALDQQHAAA
jgi:hypothetical protein